MLRVFQSEASDGFGDGGTLKQERLGALHDEATNVGGGGLARQFAALADEENNDCRQERCYIFIE